MIAYSRTRLIAVPASITLAVTILRLAGELRGWSPMLFGRRPGGGGAIVGIIWLVPIVGAYFGRRLVRLGHGPARVGRALLHVGVAAVVLIGTGLLNLWLWPRLQVQVLSMASAAVVIVALQVRGWPALGTTLLGYAISARVPVATIMYFAIAGRWGTHYDAFPEGFPFTDRLEIWLWEGLVVQMGLWIGVTVLVGALFGTISAAVTQREERVRRDAAELVACNK